MKHIFDEEGICKGCGLDGVEAASIQLYIIDSIPVEQEECPATKRVDLEEWRLEP